MPAMQAASKAHIFQTPEPGSILDSDMNVSSESSIVELSIVIDFSQYTRWTRVKIIGMFLCAPFWLIAFGHTPAVSLQRKRQKNA
jgi:hypothetical protein